MRVLWQGKVVSLEAMFEGVKYGDILTTVGIYGFRFKKARHPPVTLRIFRDHQLSFIIFFSVLFHSTSQVLILSTHKIFQSIPINK